MKKMLPWLVSLLLAITLIVIVGLYSWSTLFGDSGSDSKDPAKQAQESVKDVSAEPMSADEMIKVTSELKDIKTNIADTEYVVMLSLSFQLDSEKSKEEFEKVKDIQIKPIVNRALWVLTPEELSGTEGKDKLQASLINAINPVLSEGKVTKVEITNFIMTQI
ncbi:flagellar basal body-associated FliL family protein [Cohnella thailandensis]|uniref:Flagellar protein FliL n=1 Tax=Cohnella thailandensis TaxID=557557 RepID=A0A841T0W2_9BACL|nr:flagellar basal body-associated FliL family protein [Cohnella thailandensis]MBB6636709.1 flagellar basal body-associated FliL family protein [Cohnella thailandensis]MBP1973415.1 flagellar FliL protein [Cohnella thailandensis]